MTELKLSNLKNTNKYLLSIYKNGELKHQYIDKYTNCIFASQVVFEIDSSVKLIGDWSC